MSTNTINNLTPQSLLDVSDAFGESFSDVGGDNNAVAAHPEGAEEGEAADADMADAQAEPAVPPPIPNPRLQQLHDELNPDDILRSHREPSTFRTWQYVHTSLVFYIHEHQPEFMAEDFQHHLHDVEAAIDYDRITNPPKPYRGKLSIGQRKKNYREKILRQEISDALGHGGLRALQNTINLETYTQDPQPFVDYLVEKTKGNGKYFVPDHYAQMKSHFNNFCKRHQHSTSKDFDILLSKYIDGFMRKANKARQFGEGNAHSGSRALPWALYVAMCSWFYALPGEDGIFAAAFAKITVNMACRGDTSGKINLKNLLLADAGDCFGIPSCQSKDNQTGTNPVKQIARACYANPFEFGSDWVSTTFHHLVCNPELIRDVDGPLFRGERKSQAAMFSRVLQKVLDLNVDDDDLPLCETEYSVSKKDITLYSFRKSSHTRLSTGTTAAPNSAAACLREGHSLGGVRQSYVEMEQAANEYCGRIVAGLDPNSPNFAGSFPDFVPIDIEEILQRNISDRTYKVRLIAVRREVMEVLNDIFGAEYLRRFPAIHKFLRIGLASHLIHLDAIEEVLPQQHVLRRTALFTNPKVEGLKRHVKIACPWDETYKYFAPAQGLPPHVLIMAEIKKQGKQIDNLIPKLQEMLDDRQMNGNVSASQIRRIIENSPTIKNVHSLLAELKEQQTTALVNNNTAVAESRDVEMGEGGAGITARFDFFDHPDGHRRRFPQGYSVPSCKLHLIYQLWHCGDEASRIIAIKKFSPKDRSVWTRSQQKKYSELKALMESIDKAARAKERPTRAGIMSRAEANSCFLAGQDGIKVNLTTPKGKQRDLSTMKWQTANRYKISKNA